MSCGLLTICVCAFHFSDTCTLSLQAKFLEMKNNFSGALELINQVCTNTRDQFTVVC